MPPMPKANTATSPRSRWNLPGCAGRSGTSPSTLPPTKQQDPFPGSIWDNYEVGMDILLDVLDAQTQWQEAYSNMIDARV
ncbi:MAG: hypothetical protein BGO34_08210 [Bacteroidia bacterium 44-10]|nr:MAG: hypothetical protein BGO34_08210 [Bacteroidia bacterium 44-10]